MKSRVGFVSCFCLIVLTIFFSVGAVLTPALAETQSDDNEVDFSVQGYDLGEYDAKIVYNYTIEFANGISFGYDVVFNKEFYNRLSTEESRYSLNLLGETFYNNGFTLDMDYTYGKMSAKKSFDTVEDYYAASGVTGYEKQVSTAKKTKGFFFNVYESTNTTVFAGIYKGDQRFVGRIFSNLRNMGIQENKILLEYVYGTPYGEDYLSTDADSVTYSYADKIYYHSYKMNVSDYERTVTITQKAPNQYVWYLLAIVAGILVISIPVSVKIVKQRRGTDGKK